MHEITLFGVLVRDPGIQGIYINPLSFDDLTKI